MKSRASVPGPRRPSIRHEEVEESDNDMGFGLFDGDGETMGFAEHSVTSKGNINATYRVPGLITIPSDSAAHNFTIVQLKLNAAMSWISVPKEDQKAHLTVRFSAHFCCR